MFLIDKFILSILGKYKKKTILDLFNLKKDKKSLPEPRIEPTIYLVPEFSVLPLNHELILCEQFFRYTMNFVTAFYHNF